MAHSWKPDGYTSVAPYLVVDGAAVTIDFLQRVFDAAELRRFADAGGKLVHAEVRVGDTVVMIADGMPPAWPAVPAHVHVYVDDVDATYARALEAGAQSVQKPVKKDVVDRDEGGVGRRRAAG